MENPAYVSDNPPQNAPVNEETVRISIEQQPSQNNGHVVTSGNYNNMPEDPNMPQGRRVETALLEPVAVNATLLASGETLPSLPPPHEMKILQNTQSPPGAERCDSQLSAMSDKVDICRICHCEGEEDNKLISPCLCSGSLKYLHLSCLQKWIISSDKKACELCNFDYIMSTKIKPVKEWEKMELTSSERRKIGCSVSFHIVAIICVVWSLYVLIDRSAQEVSEGNMDWPFWTKLIVVAVGFTGGLIFMYVQCKMYFKLGLRLRAFNKLIFIENAPEDPHLRAEAAAKIKDKVNAEGGVVNPAVQQATETV